MRGNELLDKMELIDPSYVEAADGAPVIKKRTGIQWFVIAACICLLAVSAAAMDAGGFGTWLIESFSSRTEPDSDFSESGFSLGAAIQKIPAEELNGGIREVPALIQEQFDSYKPYMSQSPGYFQKTFDSREEAVSYIGFDGIKQLSWNIIEKGTDVHVHGTESGAILSVSIETFYTADDIRLQFFTDIYTENTEDEVTIRAVTTEYAEFTESFHTTKNNQTLHIIEQTVLASGYMGVDGFLVENGVLYRLHIACLKEDSDRAKDLLYQWADLF